MKGFFKIPKAINEPVKSYAVGSPERKEVLDEYNQLFHSVLDIPLYIGADEVRTGNIKKITPPHDHQHVVATYHLADEKNVIEAIETALEARKKWSKFPWQERASIFLKAAELIAGTYRSKINAATMIGQSKTIHQAEIDSACELIDFLDLMLNIWLIFIINNPNLRQEYGTMCRIVLWKDLYTLLLLSILQQFQVIYLLVQL